VIVIPLNFGSALECPPGRSSTVLRSNEGQRKTVAVNCQDGGVVLVSDDVS